MLLKTVKTEVSKIWLVPKDPRAELGELAKRDGPWVQSCHGHE